MENEIWKDIPGYEGLYKVSSRGRIWSNRNSLYLKPAVDKLGYFVVILYSAGRRKTIRVHRLVALAFIPNPNSYKEVNHKDENKANNNIENLEWCTRAYNVNYGTARQRAAANISKVKAGHWYGTGETKRKLAEAAQGNTYRRKAVMMCKEDGSPIRIFASIYDAMEATGVNRANIIACCKGRLKHAGEYKWKYATDISS